MEDHHHHHHHPYGMADLRHFMNARPTGSTNLFTQQPTAELMNSSGPVHHHHHHQLQQSNHHHDHLAAQHHLDQILMSTRHQLNSDQQITPPMPPRSSPFLHHHHQHQLFRSDNSTVTAAAGGTSAAAATLDMDLQMSGGGGGNGDGGTGRWPRQETLTLLEIRSRLDPKFKEANQKGPLWDEVSRIMSDDHGYQRSGKKCREKFENLYKYYKKTKEGKAGRQDGKHYRFFRQLEALYGESSTTNPTTSAHKHAHLARDGGGTTFPYTSELPNQEGFHQTPRQIVDDSFTPSNSTAFATSSSDEYCSDINAAMASKKRGKKSWKAKIKDFIDGQMRKLMEKQEVWLEKMMKSIEHKEQERMMREEEWRKQEAARIDREQKFWAKERAWIEARDAGLMEALHKFTGTKETRAPPAVGNSSPPQVDHDELLSMRAAHHHHFQNQNDSGCSETLLPNSSSSESWPECEITRLIQLRTSMEPMFVQQSGNSEEEVLWEEIASNMACLGYDNRSAAMCKNKWESINNYLPKTKDQSSKKLRRSENNTTSPTMSSSCFYFQNNESICNVNQGGGGDQYRENNDLGGGGGLGGLELTTSLLTQSGHRHVNASRPPSDSNIASTTMQGSSFRFFMGDQTDNLWENYGLKLSKGDDND